MSEDRNEALAAFEKWWSETYSPLHFEWGDEAYKHHAQIAWMRALGFVEDHDEQVQRELDAGLGQFHYRAFGGNKKDAASPED